MKRDREDAVAPPAAGATPSKKPRTKKKTQKKNKPAAVSEPLGPESTLSQVTALGMKKISEELALRGLKCGGALKERAERLHAILSLKQSQIPVKWLSKTARQAVSRGERVGSALAKSKALAEQQSLAHRFNIAYRIKETSELFENTVKHLTPRGLLRVHLESGLAYAHDKLAGDFCLVGTASTDGEQAAAVEEEGQSQPQNIILDLFDAAAASKARLLWEQEQQSSAPLLKLDAAGDTEVEAGASSPRVDASALEHAFPVADLDHCETPPEAYTHIACWLRAVAKRLNKEPQDLKIYDPYFCAGAVKRRLTRAGFPNVYNRNEDFYAVQREGKLPEFDVLVTNPPYSADHVSQLCQFLLSCNKPWACLMPNYVYTKYYWNDLLDTPVSKDAASPDEEGGAAAEGAAEAAPPAAAAASGAGAAGSASDEPTGPLRKAGVTYLTPYKRYYYWTPRGVLSDLAAAEKRRGHKGTRGERTSPFLSFWYCWVPNKWRNKVSEATRKAGDKLKPTASRERDGKKGSPFALIDNIDMLPASVQYTG